MTTDLLVVDRKIQEALVEGNSEFLSRHLADDLMFTHGFFTGGVETKAKLLVNAAAKKGYYSYRRVSSQVAEIHGPAALVLGRLDVRRVPIAGNAETGPMCYALEYIHLYVWADIRWQMQSHRTVRMLGQRVQCNIAPVPR